MRLTKLKTPKNELQSAKMSKKALIKEPTKIKVKYRKNP